jgi:hypothetical protein
MKASILCSDERINKGRQQCRPFFVSGEAKATGGQAPEWSFIHQHITGMRFG